MQEIIDIGGEVHLNGWILKKDVTYKVFSPAGFLVYNSLDEPYNIVLWRFLNAAKKEKV